jgi:hypothetical protein
MGGDILVQSQPGVGSRFSFELDLSAADGAAPLQQNPYPPLVQHPVPDSEPSAPLLAPPPEEMRELHRLAQRGNMRDIIQCAEHIAGLDPAYQAFAARLRQLAQGYQSKAILAFTEHHLHDKAG